MSCAAGGLACNRRRFINVEEGRHVLPFGKAFLELEHFILERADFLGHEHEVGIAATNG